MKIIRGKRSAQEKFYIASQWQLMWWKFRKHKIAIASGVMIIFYFIVCGGFCEFFAPYDTTKRRIGYIDAPPQWLHFFDEEGFHIRPFVYRLQQKVDPKSWRRTYQEDKSKKYPVYFFIHGSKYKLWGLFEADLHFLGVKNEGVILLLGADRMGRDGLSRIIYGGRISLSIGLVGVLLSLLIGVTLGGTSGYYGGVIDNIIQRAIEILKSFPAIPLWMALAAALPIHWPALKVYFGITIILSLLGWTGLARVVRGKLLASREEDFAMAAKIAGCKDMRIISRHLLPASLSYVIVSATLAIPAMILGETGLSFLGIGLRAPVVSWGVLLQEAQNIHAVVLCPWLLSPIFFIVATILTFNFLGDGLRDAADPYK